MRTLAVPLLLLSTACPPPKPATPPPPVTLTIVGMNDFHGALYEIPDRDDPGRARGGLPWLAGAMASLRAEKPDLILLDAGDLFQGSWPVNATRGMGSVRAMNLIGLDATVLGNHDFDYGGSEGGDPKRGSLEAAIAASEFAWLSSNIRTVDGSPWVPAGGAAWTMIERGGLRVAVVGVTTIETPETTLKVNIDDLAFLDATEAIRAVLPEIEAADPDVTILLGHLTGDCKPPAYVTPQPDCTPGDEIGELLAALPPGTFDVALFGHAHSLMAQRIGDTFVLEARNGGQVLNRVDLVVGPDGPDLAASVVHPPWELVHEKVDPGCEGGEYSLDPRDLGGRPVTPSAEALALVRALESEVGSLCTEIGCNAAHLPRDRERESGLGDLVADSILAAFPDADFAIQNSGGLRADLPAGKIRREHAQHVIPFENRLILVEMTGEQIRLLFRLGSSGAHGILQVSGAGYAFDPARTGGTDLDGDGQIATWETDRLCAVTVDGAPPVPDRVYKVVTTDFLFAGGDHLGAAFAGVPLVREGPLLRDAFITHIEAEKACIGSENPLPDPAAPRIVVGPCPAP